MSLAILVSEAAIVFSTPTSRPRRPCRHRLEAVGRRLEGAPRLLGQAVDHPRRDSGGAFRPGPPRCRRAAARPGGASPPPAGRARLRRGVPRELLPEADRHGVLEMGAADLDHAVELRRLAVERRGQDLERRLEQLADGEVGRRRGSPWGSRRCSTARRSRGRSGGPFFEPTAPPRISIARLASTSLTFMLVEVAEPVWKYVERGTGRRCSPRSPPRPPAGSPRRSPPAPTPARRSPPPPPPSSAPPPRMNRFGSVSPETGKLRRARSVCAP